MNPGCLVGASGCPEVLLPAAGSTHPELKVGLETQAWKMDAEALQRGFRRLLPEKPEQEGLQGRVAEGGPLPSSSLSLGPLGPPTPHPVWAPVVGVTCWDRGLLSLLMNNSLLQAAFESRGEAVRGTSTDRLWKQSPTCRWRRWSGPGTLAPLILGDSLLALKRVVTRGSPATTSSPRG